MPPTATRKPLIISSNTTRAPCRCTTSTTSRASSAVGIGPTRGLTITAATSPGAAARTRSTAAGVSSGSGATVERRQAGMPRQSVEAMYQSWKPW